MHRVLLLGAGKIGRMIARLLVDSGDYDVIVGDVSRAALERIAKRHRRADAAGRTSSRRANWPRRWRTATRSSRR